MLKYEKIAFDIKEDILSEKYNVSKMTVKKALDLLVNDGLIIKRRGSGTFVKDITEKEIQRIIEKKQFSGLTTTSIGHKVTSKVLEFKIINATKEIADILKIEEDEFIYFVHRVRYVDDKAVVIEKTYIPLNLIPGMKLADVKKSIYGYIKDKLGLNIQSAHSTVRAMKSDELDRKYLNLEKDEPILEVERVAYLDNGKVFEYSFSRHRYDKFEFKSITVI